MTHIAIAINLSGSVYAECKNILGVLRDDNSIHFIDDSQVTPHITLSIGSVSDSSLGALESRLNTLVKELKHFTIQTNGLGLFLQDKINLYIRWNFSVELQNIKEKIENSLKDIWEENESANSMSTWIPRTSLAYEDIDYKNISEVNYTKIRLEPSMMLVDEIVMIKYARNHPEEELQKFKID